MVTPQHVANINVDSLEGLAEVDEDYFEVGDQAEIRLPLDPEIATEDQKGRLQNTVWHMNKEFLQGEYGPPSTPWPGHRDVVFLFWDEGYVSIRYLVTETQVSVLSLTPGAVGFAMPLLQLAREGARFGWITARLSRMIPGISRRVGDLRNWSLLRGALKSWPIRKLFLALQIYTYGSIIFAFIDADDVIKVIKWAGKKAIGIGLKGIGAPTLIGIAVIGVGVILLSAAPSAAAGLGARRLISGRND